MAVTYEMVKSIAAELYGSCLKKIPEDTKDALRKAHQAETHDGAKKILALMLRSAQNAETTDRHVCSDAGVPVYFIKIGTAARLEGDIRKEYPTASTISSRPSIRRSSSMSRTRSPASAATRARTCRS